MDRAAWFGLVMLVLAGCGEGEAPRVVRQTTAVEETNRGGDGRPPVTLPPKAIATH
jgi:hypothetical protein